MSRTGHRVRARHARRAIGAVVVLLGVAAGVVSLGPRSASAGNTEHKRTPVLWPDAPCLQTVVRSVDPLFEFNYSIPIEDTQLSVDELDDSRTQQFVGFCRQWPTGRPPPRYISVSDLERAIAAGFELVLQPDDPEATLETSVEWADCWTRITADDARRPITYEAAAEPVVWDTTGVAAGTWLIAGYTWEPQYNLWSRAPWVVRVRDDDPPLAPVQAAASMADTADALYFDESFDVDICVDASPGSTVSFEWVSSKTDPVVWNPIASTALELGGEQLVSFPFVPPEPSWGATLLLRAVVEPLDAPGYVTHALGSVIVYKPSDGPGDTGETGDAGETGDTGSSGTGAEDPKTTEDTGPGDTGTTGHCSVAPARATLLPVLFVCVFGLGLRGRQRRSASCRPRPRTPRDHAAQPVSSR